MLDKGINVRLYLPTAFLAIKTLTLTGYHRGEITDLECDELDLENCELHLKSIRRIQCSAVHRDD